MPLKRRIGQLPHEAQYFLDGAVEWGELTASAHMALTLYGEADRIDEILQIGMFDPGIRERSAAIDGARGVLVAHPTFAQNMASRLRRATTLEEYGAELLAQCPPARRYAMLLGGLVAIVHHTDETAQYLARSAYEDATMGGCREPFRRSILLTRDGHPTPKVNRRLHSPERIRRIVRGAEETHRHRQLFRTMISGAMLEIVDFAAYEAERESIVAELNEQIAEENAARRRTMERALADDMERESRAHQMSRAHQIDGVKVTLKPEFRRRARHRRVKRAVRFAEQLVGREAVSKFARGQQVVIPGETVAFGVTRAKELSGLGGHGAISVQVLTPDGTPLARLCVYQNETPPLDQLATIALHVQAGEEDTILDQGNLFAFEPAAATFPAIADRVARKAEARAALRPGRDDRELFQLRVEGYLTRTLPIYQEAIRVAVFGPEARRLLMRV